MSDETTPTIKLPKARISYPNIFRREVFQGKEGKYSSVFLVAKTDIKTLKTVRASIDKALASANVEVSKDKWFIQDGDASGKPEYAGYMVIKASENKRPIVMNKDKSPLSEDDGVIYGGCLVNGLISVWVQNNSYGRRVNCNLLGIQFAGDAESFGSGGINPEEVRGGFDDESGGEGDDPFDGSEDDDIPF